MNVLNPKYALRSLHPTRSFYSFIGQGVKVILDILERVEGLAQDTPPVDNSRSRFGNPAFRAFYDKVSEVSSQKTCYRVSIYVTSQNSAELHKSLLGLPDESVPELTAYFNESWGNRTRVDYGSGMELNFLCWL